MEIIKNTKRKIFKQTEIPWFIISLDLQFKATCVFKMKNMKEILT